MIKNTLVTLSCVTAISLCCLGCQGEPEIQLPPAVQAPVQVPVVAPPVVVAPVPVAPTPPPTPLIPVEEQVATTGGSAGIDAPIGGKATTGDELLGNYTCKIDTKDLPLGISPPSFGCKIYRAGDGNLHIGGTGQRGSIKGTVTDTKSAGFYVVGTFGAGAGEFAIKARMKRKGAGKFSGAGRGVLNGNKAQAIKYTLTMSN